MTGLLPHTLPAPVGLIEVDTVLDIGPGLRPMNWYTPKRHICVEPHAPYVRRLEAAGYETLQMTALSVLADPSLRFDAVYMLDVIEHMTREEGEEVLWRIYAHEPQQIVICTPVGFLKQDHDAWGLGGAYWQTHRSGWTPEDFPGWRISYYGPCFVALSR